MKNDLFDLTGRVAIVTGASRGLGQNLARALAKAGADLVITSRHRDHLLTFESEIKSLGRRAVSLQLDVRDLSSIQQMAAAAESAFGHIDILVNNAGCNVRKPALEVTWDDWNLILDTNLRGSFFVAQAVARLMAPRRYARTRRVPGRACRLQLGQTFLTAPRVCLFMPDRGSLRCVPTKIHIRRFPELKKPSRR